MIADDIVIVGMKQNYSNHNQALTIFLETATRCNVRLNYEKLQYKKKEVIFFSETYAAAAHKPDQSKVSTITKMPVPTSKKQVQSFIGKINYLPKFSVRLFEVVEQMRELSKYKVPFNADPEYQSAFTQMKKRLQALPY